MTKSGVFDAKTAAPASAGRFDARDPVFRERTHECFDELRAERPVFVDRKHDRVILTRAADVAAAVADRTLSSDPAKSRSTAYIRRSNELGSQSQSLLFLDDPDHARLRRLVTQAFSARAVEAMAPRVKALAADLLDRIEPAQPFDLIASFAGPLPTFVIAAVLGVDETQVDDFKRWSEANTAIFTPDRSEAENAAMIDAREQLNSCFLREIAARHERPRDDLIGALVAAEAGGDRLTVNEIVNTCRLLLGAGNVTTTDLIGNGAVALLHNPGELVEIRADPSLWPSAVEEILRFDTPVTSVSRHPVEERRIGGCPVEAGQTITVMLAAANHDPELHKDPHRFSVTRGSQKHYSFGGGAHFCLGASLARMEGRIALEALFDRFPDLKLVEDRPLRHKAQPAFQGYERIWVQAR